MADRGIRVPRQLAAAGYGGPGGDGPGLMALPDWTSRRSNPWDERSQIVVAQLRELDGAASALCSRSALRGVLGLAATNGLEIRAAAELEFFLLDPASKRPVFDEIHNYSITKAAELEYVLGPVRNELSRMDIPIEAVNPEYAGGQIEVNIRYEQALAAADSAILARHFIREVTRSRGLDATFLAKPWTDRAGSGMHIHQSLWRDGQNVMQESGDLSRIGRSYLAGLLRHMRELALLGSPTPNAYHRRADYSFAPTVIAWGIDNRTLAVRAIVESPEATRVEHRDASSDCNVYLAMAGQFAAGLQGVRERMVPSAPVTGDAYLRDDLEKLPQTFHEAFQLFRESSFARRTLGAALTDSLLAVLEPELALVVVSSSDWERDRYLPVL